MSSELLVQLVDGIGIDQATVDGLEISFTGNDRLPSCFKTTEFASSCFAAVACALAEFRRSATPDSAAAEPTIKRINVDHRLASLWFDKSLAPINWQVSGPWDAIAGDYPCVDGWIRLHTNAPHHRQAALSVLQCEGSKAAVTSTLSECRADTVEQAIVDAGGCAATMRSLEAWHKHPQGLAVAAEPLVHWHEHGIVDTKAYNQFSEKKVANERPLAGVRVLDLTRVLAGPVSTRCLAAYGANVLRIDPLSWNEPGVVPEVTLGKRCAHVDLKTPDGRERLLALLKTADVIVHGYRPGAMIGLGFSTDTLLEHNPALINISLCAYGWTGPWSQRRGFDSLVQMSAGLADEGMQQYKAVKPTPLPVQALDHATGYLMAASALHALAVRKQSGRVLSANLSLAKTADVLQQHKQVPSSAAFDSTQQSDLQPQIEKTGWGDARRVRFPIELNGIDAAWDWPAGELRTSTADWG